MGAETLSMWRGQGEISFATHNLNKGRIGMQGRTKITLILTTIVGLLMAVVVRSQDAPDNRLGGEVSVSNTTENAFGQPAPNLERPDERFFFVGNSFFNQNWVQAPASTTARDGLGPLVNARSCAGCHFKDGRGRPFASVDENTTGFLVRLSIPTNAYAEPLGDPIYGGQFHDLSVEGLAEEGDIAITYSERVVTFDDGRTVTLQVPQYELVNLQYGALSEDIMLSPRVANQMIGLGLLEAIAEEDLLANADPDDADDDGISGQSNTVWDYVANDWAVGRFGWKANQPTLLQQVAAAFNSDMGITTSLFPELNCMEIQGCEGLPSGGSVEIDDDDLGKVVLYSSTLAVPVQRDVTNLQVQEGSELFIAANCNACHIETFTTGDHPIGTLANQTIRPYTDLLLHDMGAELADNRPDFAATGSEWRTPPLWGIGLIETVNGHTNFLHDGRARNMLEAILWHGGEAAASRDTVLGFSEEQVNALIAFLKSL